ncbi:MAG: transmembrane protein (PGPGW) [Gammaproteobacteria bacterium BRH_c0]|nr:MAG: transmembrane protein (PGPGW) [Gammaproteobacteria bacterium BRH_c0]
MPDQWILWLTVLSIATFVISLAVLPWLVAHIPEDYFLYESRTAAPWKEAKPLLRYCFMGLKNLFGLMLLAGGFLMIFIPGQGLLTMAMGLLLLDYPGKFRLERRIVTIPAVYKGLNWLRNKQGVAPLRTDRHS